MPTPVITRTLNHPASFTTSNIIEPGMVCSIASGQLIQGMSFVYMQYNSKSQTFATLESSESLAFFPGEINTIGEHNDNFIEEILNSADAERMRKYIQHEYSNNLDKMRSDSVISAMKYYRIKRKLKQTELARILNVQQHQISTWERMPNLGGLKGDRLKDIAHALCITIEELVK